MNIKSLVFNLIVLLGLVVVVVAALGGFGGQTLDPASGYGPNPVLPPPRQSLIPVLNPP